MFYAQFAEEKDVIHEEDDDERMMIICRYLQQHYQMFERDEIPGPKPVLLIGNLGEFSREVGYDAGQY